MEELEAVLFRPKFDAYVTAGERVAFFDALRFSAELIHNVAPISICRDPKDDKLLALSLAGKVEFFLTGDQDLLILNPFRGVDILNPRQYLGRQHM